MGSAVDDRRVGLKSVTSAVEVLKVFETDEELGVTDVARQLHLSKSTAHRLVSTLASGGLLDRNPLTGRYRLGLYLYELGQLAGSRHELTVVSTPVLQELQDVTGWTVHLTVARGPDCLNLERVPTLRGMKAMNDARRRWPSHAAAAGKVLCAFDPAARAARMSAGFPALTPATLTAGEQFNRQLALVRQLGFAKSVDELRLGLTSLAAPVFDGQGKVRAAVSIAGASEEFHISSDRLSRVVIAAGRRLSMLLNHR